MTHKSLPDNSNRTESSYLPVDSSTALAQQFLPSMQKKPGLSGIYLLDDSHEAFLARLALAASAQKTLYQF